MQPNKPVYNNIYFIRVMIIFTSANLIFAARKVLFFHVCRIHGTYILNQKCSIKS